MSLEFSLMRSALRATYVALERDLDPDPCDACGKDAWSNDDGRCMNPECPSNNRAKEEEI